MAIGHSPTNIRLRKRIGCQLLLTKKIIKLNYYKHLLDTQLKTHRSVKLNICMVKINMDFSANVQINYKSMR